MRAELRGLAVSLLLASACSMGSDAKAGGRPVASTLEVRNLTQWSVWEVKLHAGPSYLDAENRIAPPLAPRGAQRLTLGAYDGEAFVTVVRDKRASGDEKIAFTSAHPIDLHGFEYALEVLENEFRLRPLSTLAPPDAAARDGGVADAAPPPPAPHERAR